MAVGKRELLAIFFFFLSGFFLNSGAQTHGMKVGELLDNHVEKVGQLAEHLKCLRGYPVFVLEAPNVQEEVFDQIKGDRDKRLEWLALNVYLKSIREPPSSPRAPRRSSARSSYFQWGALVVASRSIGMAVSIFKTLIRMRSHKVQALLWKWSMLLYYTLFRFKRIYKGLLM